MASRVVPASGAVSRRSSPISRLTSVDLPAFGPPDDGDADRMRARRAWPTPRSAPRCVRAAPRAARRRDRPGPRCARRKSPPGRRGRARRRRAGPPRRRCPSILLAISTAGLPDLRTSSAKTRSTPVGPARASIMKKMASACPIAVSVCARMRPVRLSGADSSRPAVSITVKSRSPSRPSPSRRSRVTPGRSSTSATRRPTSRLNSVDLPTLGRPTMAMVKLISFRYCRA